MKIGLVCPYNMVKGGGVQECVRAIRDELERRGHDAYILTPKPRGEFTPERHVIYLGLGVDIATPLQTTAQVSVNLNTKDLQEVMDKEQFELLHFHEPWAPMMSGQILDASHAVNVATFHAKLPDTVMAQGLAKVVAPYTKSILKSIHAMSAVSTAAREYVDMLTDREVQIIPNGINLDAYHTPKKRVQHRKKIILYIGRLEGRKGVRYLIKAFAELTKTDPDVRLVIAGNGDLRKNLEHLAYVKLKLNNVEFLGYISEAKKHELLQSADVFCSPALYGESFGIVLLEAMASGAVTVAGNNPGYASVLTGAGAISLVNPKNTVDFAQRLQMLLNEPLLREAWLAWAAGELPQYDYRAVVDRYEAMYKKALVAHGNN